MNKLILANRFKMKIIESQPLCMVAHLSGFADLSSGYHLLPNSLSFMDTVDLLRI